MKKIFLSLLLLPVALLAGCKKDKGGCAHPKDDCSTVLCTADFRTISVCLRDANNQAFTVDSVQTTLTDGTRVQTNGNEGALPAPGCYGVVSDNWVQGHANTRTEMRFRAFRGGQVVVNETFMIGADCCHVSKISGPETVSVP